LPLFLFVSDLHGQPDRYAALEAEICASEAGAVLLGGDLLPHFASVDPEEYVEVELAGLFLRLRGRLGSRYPDVVLVLGNDDTRLAEAAVVRVEQEQGLWRYAHRRRVEAAGWPVLGYGCVPPTPFRLKDFERYDVSRYLDPGCIAPEDGFLTVEVPRHELRFGTIMADLEELVGEEDLRGCLLLSHCPPYRTHLDQADLAGQKVDDVPLDVHIGSLALRRLVEARQPRIGLHGHVHEAARLTGTWRDAVGDTTLLGAAHEGPELAVVLFDPEDLGSARRVLRSGPG